MITDPTKAPLFIVGAQRSGTTMLRLMLNSHPSLAVPFETPFLKTHDKLAEYGDLSLESNAKRLLDDFAQDRWLQDAGLVPHIESLSARDIGSFSELVSAVFWQYAKSRAKPRWGMKVPGYVTQMDRLWQLFPGCRFIHVVRDGRDVALSYRRISWGTSDLPEAAAQWRWKATLGRKMGAMIGDCYLEIRYEELVLRPAEVLQSICDFLHEPYDERMLDYHRWARDEMPSRSLEWHQTSISPPDPKKVFEWKRNMSKSDRIIFDQISGDALDLFGYERESSKPSLRSRAKWMYYAFVKRCLV